MPAQARRQIMATNCSLKACMSEPVNCKLSVNDFLVQKTFHVFINISTYTADIGKLDEGNFIFCCMGSQENYFGSVGRENDNNPKYQGWLI